MAAVNYIERVKIYVDSCRETWW